MFPKEKEKEYNLHNLLTEAEIFQRAAKSDALKDLWDISYPIEDKGSAESTLTRKFTKEKLLLIIFYLC